MANQIAYGFVNLKDVFARRVTQVGIDVVTAAIDRSVQEHNRQMDALLRLFARRTTSFKVRYRTPAAARLQPLDTSGRARPIRGGSSYDVAFPLRMAGVAWGNDYVTGVKMTVEEANEYTYALITADKRWVRDHILAGLFANASWTFSDENDNVGSLTIKGPANNDSDVYALIAGADVPAVDQHFFAQANAISDADNPFPTIYLELTEHPDNAGEVVALIPTNQRSAVEGLATFTAINDPNLQLSVNANRLIGNLNVAVPGVVFGYVNKVWCVEWRSLPDNYILATTTEGEPALGMREDAETELQGFNLISESESDGYPWYIRQYMRRAGFGAWNRVGVVVYRIGNGAYGIPTGYDSPLS